VPPNEVETDKTWQIRYHALIERYANIIRGQIFGHTHTDHIVIMRGITHPEHITGILYILPQLGVFTASNPSFRIFDLDN